MVITYNGGRADREVLAENFTALRWTKQTDTVILDRIWDTVKNNNHLDFKTVIVLVKAVYRANTTRGRLVFSEYKANIDGEERNVFEIIRKGVFPAIVIKEGKDKPKVEVKKNWYTWQEMHAWLKSQNYSEEIAKELSERYAENLNLSYQKGYDTDKLEQVTNNGNWFNNFQEIESIMKKALIEQRGAVPEDIEQDPVEEVMKLIKMVTANAYEDGKRMIRESILVLKQDAYKTDKEVLG